MGNALEASLRILQTELEKVAQVQSASVLASLRTIEHVKDVLTAKKAHFDPKYADELVGAASGDLLQPSKPAISSAATPVLNTSILDQSSPTLSATDTLSPIAKSALNHAVAPPRTRSAQAHASSSYAAPNNNTLPLAPAPMHVHSSAVNHASSMSTGSDFPDLGDWQSLIEPIAHPLSGMPVMPKLPPASRIGGAKGTFRQSTPNGTALEPVSLHQRHPHSRQQGEETDPLGALF